MSEPTIVERFKSRIAAERLYGTWGHRDTCSCIYCAAIREIERLTTALYRTEESSAAVLAERDQLRAQLEVWGAFKTGDVADKVNAMATELLQLRASEGRAVDALEQIQAWADAYPVEVFPEPDFVKVRTALLAAGITIDAVSASNMRHVLNGVRDIVTAALAETGKVK